MYYKLNILYMDIINPFTSEILLRLTAKYINNNVILINMFNLIMWFDNRFIISIKLLI